jgi:hypothetical protein
MEAAMRTTPAHDNVLDFNALLHPGTVFSHPRDVVADHGAQSFGEARNPGLMGIRRVRHRILPCLARARMG